MTTPTWPLLREELALHEGAAQGDGQPTWTLQDPTRNLFFRIDWLTFEILSRWRLADPAAICQDIAQHTVLHPHDEDVASVLQFVSENHLVQVAGPADAAAFEQERQKLHGTWGKWLLHNYLFFRIPLVNPDPWLDRWVSRVEFFFSKTFQRITLAALALGLLLVYRDWNRFSSTLIDTLSWTGLLGYGVAITAVKLLHELGHAFTAKRYGCRVPAMGVAFLVLWPVAYTDTNEVWTLSKRHDRLTVAAAGVATELVIAVWATLAWALLPDGVFRSMAFMLATVSWIATVALNASPFMRFDGYFVLSDWLDMPNLHNRSFALARWYLRERLFDLQAPPPEYFSRRKTYALIVFAYITWIYRLVVFLGIAALVYHFFIKLVGILLFVVEMVWFVSLPIYKELKIWHEMLPQLKTRPRARRSAAWAIGLSLLLIVPWPTRLTASGYLKPEKTFTVYAPAGAQIAQLPWKEGALVKQGEPILLLASPELDLRWQRAQARLKSLQWQSSAAGVDPLQRQNLQVLQQEYASSQAEMASVQAELERYIPTAPFTGKLYDVDPDLQPGVWVASHEKLATLVQPGKWQVEVYLDEDAARRVRAGDGAQFFTDGLEGPFLSLKVVRVDQDATRVIHNSALVSQFGGSVVTREKNNQHIPEHATYRVLLESKDKPGDLAGHSWRGHVVIRGSWQAPGLAFLRSALAVVWREAGF